ncbi:MAG TPA: HlyD family efflux transporter periplasmic adaptor subunit [Pelagibacterium sp.]|uniref:HlyD family secretion protein n=1 Tax=Pelagibacterium sp. TaxID=1967288 RepID=UPI002BB2B0FF|nr:HlyD family efflux transporter periplasmic adaptor subunit [Pelagibacterium sp.]HWJ87276.1 HlyD family efflux transporter periplasmic adaptor subunit [Pelagibacterium sp.]
MDQFIAWLFGLIALIVPGFGAPQTPIWNGYVEADYVYVAAPGDGTIAAITASEGTMVGAGDILFTLDDRAQQAALRAAAARVEIAEANADNLATGSRDAELDVIRANLEKARADLDLARSQAQRTDEMLARGLVSQAQADRDHTTLASAQAQLTQIEAQLRVAELPARNPQRDAAQASLIAARADAEQARFALADRTIRAPLAGQVERIYFAAGEFVAPGGPVVALLPDDALKVKFFVPEADRTALSLGQSVAISCDGCQAGLTATLSFFASEPQFTPPLIYSREERERLTFLVEATLDAGVVLHPGQPVTVEP